MLSAISQLKRLDNARLIKVVKNYRQYGYDDAFREMALDILAERGITREQLILTGNFSNAPYEYGSLMHRAFRINSRTALVLYLLLLLTYLLDPLYSGNAALSLGLHLLQPAAAIFFFFFLVKAFLNQCECYKALGRDYGTEGALLYFFLGIPLYIIMYFYFRRQMIEVMREIS